MDFLIIFVRLFFDIFSLIILVRVIISWLNVRKDIWIVQFVSDIGDPILNRARKVIPAIGMIDISPIVVLIGMDLIKVLIILLLQSF